MSAGAPLAGMPFALAQALFSRIDPERAHALTIAALKAGLGPRAREPDPPALAVETLGLAFPNPLGLAAGFDKNAEVPDAMLAAGFGFVEAGTVTPRPQAGNPRPRLFRLPHDGAVINRMGFNNEGHAAARARLEARRRPHGIVGINIGANRDAADPIADYCAGLSAFAGLADYVAVNVSSPNTPGLRDLQERERLDALLAALTGPRAALPGEADRRPPILLKIAPDLDDSQIADICRLARARGIDGLIVSNTTVARPGLADAHAREQGGLSGRPLFALSTRVLAKAYLASEGALTLVGTGGVSSGADAYAKIRAGASLVQLYTALVYEGPELIGRIKTGLARALARDGLHHIGEAVGRDANGWAKGKQGEASTGGRR